MSGRDQSDAIWIRQQEQYPKPGTRHSSIDFGPSRFSFGRSMSINSEGASTCSSSPPNSPFEMSSKSGALNIPPAGGRFRTSSFSAGYGPSSHDRNDHSGHSFEKDPYLIHSPLSTSAPGRESLFRRSNSISASTDYSNSKSGKNSANLGPIDEVGKMYHFGDAIKRSMGQLFSAPKMMPPPKSEKKKQGQMQDRVVSMLCESAIR